MVFSDLNKLGKTACCEPVSGGHAKDPPLSKTGGLSISLDAWPEQTTRIAGNLREMWPQVVPFSPRVGLSRLGGPSLLQRRNIITVLGASVRVRRTVMMRRLQR
jgi:hypothetical protein